MSPDLFWKNPSLLYSISMFFMLVIQMIFNRNCNEIAILVWYVYIKVKESSNESLCKIMWVAYKVIIEQSPVYANLFLIDNRVSQAC